jgi:signal transduction histidine kinase
MPADTPAYFPEPAAQFGFIGSDSPMRKMVRTYDWASTPLGPVEQWPAALKVVTGIVLNSASPMFLWWGEQLIQIYNDAYVPCFGTGKHPQALGQPGRECWHEIWQIIGPQIDSVLGGEQARWYQDNLVPILRNGHLEDVYWSYTYAPVHDEVGAIRGVLVVCTETTASVLAERRRHTLDALGERLARCVNLDEVWQQAVRTAADDPGDIRALHRTSEDAGGDDHVTIVARDLNMDTDLAITYAVSTMVPFDAPFRHFLEQYTTIVGTAFLRIEKEAMLAIANAERDRLLLDAPVGTAIMLGPELVYHLVNPIYSAVSGRPASDMLGRPFADVFPELVGSPVHTQFKKVFGAGTPYSSEETLVRISRHGGPIEDRYFIYNLAPLRRLHGGVYGLMVIAVDITLQVGARTEIERLNTDLNAAARAKDEFLAMLGHELRNPLAPIVSALGLMKLRDASTGKEQAIIRRQVDHLIRLVDDLLDVSRITRGLIELRVETVDLRDVLGKAIEMASPLFEQKEHQLTVDTPSMPWRGDPARLAQVVANLLTNAARYTPRRGAIVLSARLHEGSIEIDVTDNGQGIPADLLHKVFDLFVQGGRQIDRAEGGLGIGLALVKNLVHLHSGSVGVHSEGAGKGSRFSIRLPQGSAGALAPAESALAASAPPRTARRILVVDDNRDAADTLGDWLGTFGNAVRVTYDPAQALLLAAQEMPDLAILDIGLPGMTGYELAAHIRALPGGHAPALVALTGYGQEHDRERSVAEGFSAHLVKPVDLGHLAQLLETIAR